MNFLALFIVYSCLKLNCLFFLWIIFTLGLFYIFLMTSLFKEFYYKITHCIWTIFQILFRPTFNLIIFLYSLSFFSLTDLFLSKLYYIKWIKLDIPLLIWSKSFCIYLFILSSLLIFLCSFLLFFLALIPKL